MRFDLSEEQRLLRDAVEAFARRELRPNAAAWDREGAFPIALTPKLAALGLLGMTASEAHGGTAMSASSLAVVIERLAWGEAGVALSVAAHNSLCTAHLARFAPAALSDRLVPRLASGTAWGAWCLTEPHAGSDAARLSVRASRSAHGYVLSGTKTFVTHGSIAGIYVVMATVDPSRGAGGITAFAVEREAPGLRIGRKEDKLGVRASDTAEVHFDDVVVPAEHRIGEEGEGFGQALAILERGRIGIGAMAVGIGRAALEDAVAYAKARKAFGRAIAEHQAIQWMLADSATELDAAWLLVQRAAALADEGSPFRRAASEAKLYASEAAFRAANRTLQVHGGYGFVRPCPAERHFRDVKLCEIGEGTSEVQRMIIARELLRG
jgi:alkylation response protein AidB-like acyl-CoA dehydrogenase